MRHIAFGIEARRDTLLPQTATITGKRGQKSSEDGLKRVQNSQLAQLHSLVG